ncbi:MAG: hypothetical protein ACRDOD_03455 [Streptosporangiaceae bacterium]
MAHYSRLSKVVIDVPPAGHDRELAFWNAAVGEPLTQFTRHPEWQLMRDPAGLVFCVLPEPPGELDDSNARRWD